LTKRLHTDIFELNVRPLSAPLKALRTLVSAAMARAADCKLLQQVSRFKFARPDLQAAVMATSTFCYCPRGDTAVAKRQYDAVASRCIPIVAANEAEWAFSWRAQPATFSLRVLEGDIVQPKDGSGGRRLVHTARGLPTERVAALQAGLAAVWRRYRYGPRWAAGEVLDSIVEELADRAAVLRELGCASGDGGLAASAGGHRLSSA